MDKDQLKQLIETTLIQIGYGSQVEAKLVTATIAIESRMGKYIKQIKGPALGILQMEPATYRWLLDGYLSGHPDTLDRIKEICNLQDVNQEALMYNLKFAICMCRVRYLADPSPLPEIDHNEIDALWGTYKRVYNTYLGATTKRQFKKAYKKYVL